MAFRSKAAALACLMALPAVCAEYRVRHVHLRNGMEGNLTVGEDGIVYQKDLGEKTGEAAASITSYNPGEGWNVVLSPDGANSRVAQRAKK